MLATLIAMPLPELAAYVLVIGIPLTLSLLAWPLLRPRRRVAAGVTVYADDGSSLPASRGLAGQWAARSHQLEAGFERQRAAMQLHLAAAQHLGALDHEIDRLWRDTRAVMALPLLP